MQGKAQVTIVGGRVSSGRAHSERCLICGRETGDGLRILGQTICRRCEARLVSTRAGSPAYEQYLRRLRRLWPDAPVDE